ncbi:uncharacterized protein LOC104884119 isoform X1 [Beta vulgaris subsp. vulgaris]|uniref:uncharacterized protein LOC104884119 isoform X1 n=1 Tax=Beta vulgaris subsp. vulgaris TaxID=3555 RepID=UPI00203727DF|nr:uncharacterized protein LOC104884119 isoform X1 [Beta vulgaris subsp. vulgaris]
MEETDNANNAMENKDSSSEQHKLSLLRSFVESSDSSSKDVDDLTLRRFLRARDLNVDKAGAMFLKYQKWKKNFLPEGHVSEAEIQDELSQNKFFIGGEDKKGRPIFVVFAVRHYKNTKPGGFDEFKRLVVYTLDKLCSRMPPGQEKFLAIGDLQGWGYSNSDIRGYLEFLSILQDCYPERLGKLFIVHAPKIFMAVWKIIYPFIDDNTKTKIEFVDMQQLRSSLLEEMDESQLPEVYGGKLSLVPIQDG